MKKLKLILLLCICCQGLFAQNPLYLRGVRYYYETPTLGNFNACSYFRTTSIVEKGNVYMIGGQQFDGYGKAGLVCINKWNSNFWWDYRTSNLVGASGIYDIITLPNNRFLSAAMFNPDTLKTVLFNQLGILSEKTAPVRRHDFPHKLTKLSATISAVTSHDWGNHPSGIQMDTIHASVDLLDEEGNYLYSKVLPFAETYNNLPVHGVAYGLASYPYYDAVVTFGEQHRTVSETNLNQRSWSPTLWVWGSDYIFFSREIYKDYAPHDASYMNESFGQIDAYDNEYAFSSGFSRPDGSGGGYLTGLDTNLHVKFFKKINVINSPYQSWTSSDLKIDTLTRQILVTGQLTQYDSNQIFVLSKVNFLARFDSNGNALYYKYFYYDHNEIACNSMSMTICENRDLLFTGNRWDIESNDYYFFTYRTDPDGYDPDGQYLGIKEVTVTPTEIGIFPNPSDGIFQVSSMFEEAMQVIILDQQEKQVALFELNELSSNSSFDLSDQAPGVYFAHISQGVNQWVKKLVVR